MTNEQRVIHIIKTTPALMTILQLIQDCHLKQGALAAGSIRNTVWQVLSGQPVMFNSDIDVVFFDPERPASDDLKIYQQLTDKAPQYQWQIKMRSIWHIIILIRIPNSLPLPMQLVTLSKFQLVLAPF